MDDFETDWTYHEAEAFDLIHARNLAGSVSSWSSIISSIFTHLEPGGWLEMQECEVEIFSGDDVKMDKAPTVRAWVKLIRKASAMFGKRYDIVDGLEDLLNTQGFLDVGRDVYEVC